MLYFAQHKVHQVNSYILQTIRVSAGHHKTLGHKDELGGLLQLLSAASEDLCRVFVELKESAQMSRLLAAGQLRDLLNLFPVSVTGLVDRKLVAGCVRRETNSRDRRRVLSMAEPAAVQSSTGSTHRRGGGRGC